MPIASSLPRARIHRSTQYATATFPSTTGNGLTINVTLSTPVTSPRWKVTFVRAGSTAQQIFVESLTLTTTTNLQIIYTKETSGAGTTRLVFVEEFF